MIQNIYIEERDTIACHRLEGQRKFALEITADLDGVPFRFLGPLSRLAELRAAIDGALLDAADIAGPPLPAEAATAVYAGEPDTPTRWTEEDDWIVSSIAADA